jgi:hypothetical protein
VASLTWTPIKFEAQVVLHELGHLYRAPDHEDNVADDGDFSLTIDEAEDKYGQTFNGLCVYGDQRYCNDPLMNHTMCEGCRSVIVSNIARYESPILLE